MPARVRRRNQISLNGVLYPTRGPVTSSLIKYPDKQVFGDQNKDTHPFTSVITWTDWSGGQGLWRTDGRADDLNRFWLSILNPFVPGLLVLTTQLESATVPPVSGDVTMIGERNDKLYVALAGGTDVREYDVSGDSWADMSADLPDAATDAIQCKIAGTEYVIFAHYDGSGSGFSYHDGTGGATPTLDSNAKDAKYLAFWDGRLWSIDHTGQLWYWPAGTALSTTATVPVNVGEPLETPDGWIGRLFVGPIPGGNSALYVSGQDGLYVLDIDHAVWIKTAVQFPRHQQGGLGACTWRGDIYISAGFGVYRYIPGAGIFAVGPDRDQGTISSLRGDIKQLIPTHNFLMARVSGSGVESVLKYNGQGWTVETYRTADDLDSMYATDANGSFRLYLGGLTTFYYLGLNPDAINPDEVTQNYDVGGLNSVYLRTAWFDAGQPDVDKTALRIKAETKDCDADDQVRIRYATDYSDSFSANVLTINADGVTTGTFPTIADTANEAGTAFKSIRFEISMQRGSTTTITPQLLTLTLEWRRKLPARYTHTVEVDLTGERGRTPLKLRAALVTAIESTAPVELSYRDDDGNTRNYFVDVISAEGIEQTGRDERGVTKLTMVEP
jgi:hypothetical protein